ncbi:hypothetical protein M3Y98_00494700 [Aphelenchoides besseyi]|nr:hypothetical protein M3Y98_00494700 [Aphelenchoides besseyi]KAI6207707.1 hypothetical protein M3Y96_00037400 [Aphelenchoides besseyi]
MVSSFDNFPWSLSFVLIICTLPTISQLILKACCNGDKNCNTYQRPEEMFGVSCCGHKPINDFESICCDNVTRHRQVGGGFVDRCCGNQTLNYDQTCCQGIVYNVPNGECCGPQAYARNSFNVLCCNGTLNTNVEQGATCCGNKTYDGGIREACCDGQVNLKELFDGCCPLLNSNPPKYKQFNSRTHLCCDVPIERESNTKCCYLSNRNGTFTPKSYDFSTSCCAYPFREITPKTGDSCIPTQTDSRRTTTTVTSLTIATTTPEQ